MDRFGPLLHPVDNLMHYGLIRLLSHKIRVKTIDRVGPKVVLAFFPTTPVDLGHMAGLLTKRRGSITPQGVVTFRVSSSDDTAVLNETISFLKELTGM
jgi:transcription-repair coupling factor (superfamily II helicase)